MLLSLYPTPEDIEHRRDASLEEFDAEIAAKTAELEQLDTEITQLEPGTAERTKHLRERDELDTALLTLTAKKENAAYGFKEDIERLRYLQKIAKDTAAN